jgi:hypothetical protein
LFFFFVVLATPLLCNLPGARLHHKADNLCRTVE